MEEKELHFKIKDGITYVPRFVRQESDLRYGEIVTHENYNEKLNLNTTQGDYNTEILRVLFTDENGKNVPHIPYLDRILETEVNRIDHILKHHHMHLKYLDKRVDKVEERIGDIENTIEEIIDGTQSVGHALLADNLTGVFEAGPHQYYGTDYDMNIGFFELPDAIYAEDIGGHRPEISGIYFKPRPDSVDESMLTPEVREKLNRQSITDYDELTGRPKINGIILTGDRTLDELGIQPKGNYLTSIPSEYINEERLTEILKDYLTIRDASNTYVTQTEYNSLKETVTNLGNTGARVFIGSTGDVTPKNGDLLITL